MIDKILNLFKGEKEKKVTKIYRLPENEKFTEYIDKIIDRKLADTLSENYKLRERIKQLESLLGKRSDEEFKKIKEKAKEIYKVQKKLENKKRIILRLKTDSGELPVFFLKSNATYKNYKWFWGVELYETDEGYTIYYPLLTDGKNVVRFKKPAVKLDDFFKERIGMVKQLNSGKLDSNFDVDEYGNPVLLLDNEGYDAESNSRIKIVNLSDQERHQYELKISQLNDIIQRLYSELEESKKREVDYKHKQMKTEMELNVAEKEKEISKSNLVASTQKQMAMFKQLTDAILSIEDVKLSQLLTEDMAKRLQQTLEITRDKLDELQRESPQDYKSKLNDMYSTFMSKLDRLNDKINMATGTPPGEK